MTEVFVGGLARLTIWGLDSNGAAIGNNTSTPANDTTTHAFSINVANEASASLSDIVRVDFNGADALQGRMTFGDNATQSIEITLDSWNPSLVTFFSGTAFDDTYNSELPFWSPYTTSATIPNVGVLLTQRAQNVSGGAAKYVNRFYPLCSILAQPGPASFQDKATLVLQITPSKSTKNMGGELFSAQNMSLPDSSADLILIESDKPLAVTSYVQNAAATTFVTGYRPTSSTVTVNATPNHLWIDGTPTALSSINTTTGVATLSAAGTAGKVDVLLYETSFVAI